MKVLIVTPYFYPSVGGVQNYVLNIASQLNQLDNYRAVIVTSGPKGSKVLKQTFQGMTVYHLPYQIKLSNTPISFKWSKQIRNIIESEKPDVINAHTPVPFMADMAIRAGKGYSTSLTYHNDLAKDSFAGRTTAKAFYVLLSNKTLQKADRIIVTSQYYADNSPYLRRQQQHISVVPPGIDIERFNSNLDKTWLRKRHSGKKIILFVGSMDKTHSHKGIPVLLEAIVQVKKNIPDVHLIAVGKGDAIPSYKVMAKNLNIGDVVSFPGFVADKDLAKYYAGSDVLVLPSTNESEGFGMVLLEALACGTPVIGSNVGGINQAINDKKDGLIVAPSNSSTLAHAIETILSNRELALRFGEYGRRKIEKSFTWKAQADKTAQIFKRLTR